MEMKLELAPIPVTDVDRAKTFYVEHLGFVEDVDVQPAAGVRIVQLTPAGSACSIGMGTGLPAHDEMAPGTIKSLHLVLADIEQPALIWSAAESRFAPSRTSAEESSTHGWPTPTATLWVPACAARRGLSPPLSARCSVISRTMAGLSGTTRRDLCVLASDTRIRRRTLA